MTRKRYATLAVLLVGATLLPAAAWGPRTDLALVGTAAGLLSRDTGVRLTNLRKDVQDGAATPPTLIDEFIPGAITNPMGAIESEMILLESVRSDRVDPYYAYRLGVLGKLVARICSPLESADSTFRNLYYADVDKKIENVPIDSTTRRIVDPQVYLPQLRRSALDRQAIIIEDYKSGLGFSGVARASLPEDASRAVNAVVDVWYTVLHERALVTNVPEKRIREFMLSAVEFYIRRGNGTETETAYKRFRDMGFATADALKQICDSFYRIGAHERAMREYEAVLELDPQRSDVARRIAEYYSGLGDEALDNSDLVRARTAYKQAIGANPLHPTAQSQLIETEKRLASRESRLEAAQAALARGKQFEDGAERETVNQDYGRAIELLLDARSAYGSVDGEFSKERVDARTGLNRISTRLTELRNELIANAGSLSGSGATSDAPALAGATADRLGRESLKIILEEQYQDEIRSLRRHESRINPGTP